MKSFQKFKNPFTIASVLIVLLMAPEKLLTADDITRAEPLRALVLLRNQAEEGKVLGETWLWNNFREKGLFEYRYNWREDESSTKNNTIRQLMASLVLARRSHGNDNLMKLHERNLNFISRYWYQKKWDAGFIYYDRKSKLGANAMYLRVLIASPKYEDYVEEARTMFVGICSLQDENGGFAPWFFPPEYVYNSEYLMYFYSGEALLSLVEYYEKIEDPDVLKIAIKAAEYYLNKYVQEIDKDYYPAYVPWHTFAYGRLFKITHERKYAEAVFTMNDRLLELLDRRNHVGRFYNPETPQYGKPHTASDAIYLESLAHAYRLAKELGDCEREGVYFDAIKLATAYLRRLQFDSEDSRAGNVAKSKYVGAIPSREGSGEIRVDNVQHAVDAFEAVLDALAEPEK